MRSKGLLAWQKVPSTVTNIEENEPASGLRSENRYSQTLATKRRAVPKYLIPDEIQSLIRTISNRRNSQRDVAIFTLAYMHGLRATEVGMVQMRDYYPGRRPENDELVIERLKGSIGGKVHLVPPAAHAIRMWVKRRGWAQGPMFLSKKKMPISQRQLDRLMKKYCAIAEIPPEKSHFHALKHTCGTYMLSVMKETLVDVKEHMGHKNIASTMIYAQLTAQANDERALRLRKWKI